jgi:hypothetical protein
MVGMRADAVLLVGIAKGIDPGQVNVAWQRAHLIKIGGGIVVSRAATAN